MVVLQIVGCGVHQEGTVVEESECSVASTTQKAANFVRDVVMIHGEQTYRAVPLVDVDLRSMAQRPPCLANRAVYCSGVSP
jgi:hypothetical protein